MSMLTVDEVIDTTKPGRAKKKPRGGQAGGGGGVDAWKLVVPTFIPIVIFSVYPLVRGIYLGFTDAKPGIDVTTTFTGFANYRQLWHYHLFWQSFRIGLIWMFSVTILQFLAALSLALLLNANLRFQSLTRTLALVPWAMPPVIIAIMWRLMLNPNSGPVNKVIRTFGFEGTTNLLGDFKTALPAVIVVGVWAGMPQTTIVLLAGLQSVPEELHEAAAIDGASTLRRFWHVTLPSLRPVIVAATTLDMIWNFNSFALVFVLTAGGPGGKTMLPMLFAYNEAFKYNHWGLAAAMGNVMVIVIAVFLLLYLRGQARSRSAR
jgi:multiple sugar transport system permease protein